MRIKICLANILTLIAFALLWAGCGSSVQPAVVAPAGLEYSESSVIYARGITITPNMPASSGDKINHYGVAPSLPAGLVMDPQTGVITGTPTEITPAALYTVTGSNSAGSATTRLQIEVRAGEAPPESLVYLDNPVIYTVNQPIIPNYPETQGGEITQYAVAPALPAGLTVDRQTGVISGTPVQATPQASYIVTGSNGAGSTEAQISIEVRAQQIGPSNLQYTNPTPVYPVGQPIVPNLPQSSGGPATSFSISPTLPMGLSLNAITGVICGTPITVQEQTAYTVTAKNSAGSTEASVLITIVPAGTWVPTDSMSVGRAYHTATRLLDGRVLIAGGVGSNNIPVAMAELYDPRTGTWSATGDMIDARGLHSATLLANGKVLVAGGGNRFGPVNTTELYDPTSGTWSASGSMSVKRYNHSAVAMPDGTVLVVGDAGASGRSATTEIYNPATGTWAVTASMLTPRFAPTATLLNSGKVIVAGGENAAGLLASSELYDPVSRIWSPSASMSTAREFHTATLLTDNSVLVTGGAGGGATAELYNPTNDTWASLPSMSQTRSNHRATLLPNGEVLVTGGLGADASTAELYDPARAGWMPASTMGTARYLHTATLLTDGRVFVTGGAPALNSAELFDISGH